MSQTNSSDRSKARFRDLPLRVRLSVPFLVLALFGTCSLVGLAILSQNELIRYEEYERLDGYQRALDHKMELQGRWAVSLASSFARNPEVAGALAQRDRLRLINLCYPAYVFMKERYGISQFNFHILPPTNFLRLQRLYEFGDALDYRETILDAVAEKRETFGLEAGLTGYGLRGVAPIFFMDQLVGTIEIGFNFGDVFLQEIKKQFGVDVSFLLPGELEDSFFSFATTFPNAVHRVESTYRSVFVNKTSKFLIRQIDGAPNAVLIRTVEDYKGNTVALVEFCMNRSETLALIRKYRQLMLGIGILGLIFSVGAIYYISDYFTRPIREMIKFAREISVGEPVHPLEVSPSGELKILADSLDDMLRFLQESREKIQGYAANLEHMVHIRTRALRESEEKYRTLVENVPLVVYRLLDDGRIIYINHFIETLMGITPRQAMEDVTFWRQKVWDEDRARVWPMMDRCLREGCEFKAEYRLQHPDGRLVYVLDHALPVLDEQGKVETVDGFLANLTDRYCLQQQIIQTEELRTISEVSARLAHEIRNPLVAAGGFARRLLQSIPAGDPNRERVQIIVSEVARLERILENTLAYLRPFEILPQRSSLNDLISALIEEQRARFESFEVKLEIFLTRDLSLIPLDTELFKKAMEAIMDALLDLCQPGSALEVRTQPGDQGVQLVMVVKGVQVSEDDIEHFFYPFTTQPERAKTLDLPLAKMIIHKHKGLVNLRPKDSTRVDLNISLPQ